jgi:xanthine dehydrogenase accessory factor
MRDFLAAVHEWLARGEDLCLATIIERKGSAPRSRGSSFFVDKNSFYGTIGGGRFEAEAIERAREAISRGRAELMHYRLMGGDVADTEMICGGNLDLYLEPLWAGDAQAQAIYQAAARVAARGGRALLATLLAPGPAKAVAGRKLLLLEGAEPVGSLDLDGELIASLANHLDELNGAAGPHLWRGPGAERLPFAVLIEPIISQPVVYIFGGGHVSQKLAPLVTMAGFGLVVADDRPEWANRARFPQADEIWNRPLNKVLDGQKLGPEAYIVIVTRGHLFDKEVLAQALRQNAAYVGMIGSRRKRALIYKSLAEEGFEQEKLEEVHSPIGLDIGAETPEEIAISIIAELVAVRAGKGARQ